MKNLIRFESKKFLASKKNIAIIVFSFLMVIGNYSLITFFDDNMMQRSFYEIQASDLANSVSELETIVQNEPAAKTALEITKKEADIVTSQVSAMNQDDWPVFLKKQIEYDKLQLKGMELGTIPLEEQQIRDLHKNIALNTYLYKNDLKPEIAGTEKQGINYAFSFLTTISPFILIALILLLVIDILNSEKWNGTRDFMNSLPYSKLKIIHSKLILYVGYAFLIILLMSLLSFIIATLFNGAGNFNYPVIFQGISPEQISISTISGWLPKYLFITLCIILFLTLLVTLISTLIQNDFIVLTVSLVILLVPSVLSLYVPLISTYSELFPVFYLNVKNLFSGDAALLNSNLVYTNALFCLIGYSLLTYLLLIFNLYRKKTI
ncbi:ABC transporter permease subunit [Listeria weihenstephanensis]|uniref:ABC transporter permease subunit n=1 Tax=Listeria weihenstephanensis TaxID=1006155 RepID=A0A841Z758_9LIST|nr:ABC-2 transporter permease [Listeria weihenstephanensis]MBC1500472.1 ABC transporter permease subunit [Listeria weihenstephanensis]